MRCILLTFMGLALASTVMAGCDRQVTQSEDTHTNPITRNETTAGQDAPQQLNNQASTNSGEKTKPPTNPNP